MKPYRKPTPKELGAISVERIDMQGKFVAIFKTRLDASISLQKLRDMGFYPNKAVRSFNSDNWMVHFYIQPHKSNPNRRILLDKELSPTVQHIGDGFYRVKFSSKDSMQRYVKKIRAKGYKTQKRQRVDEMSDDNWIVEFYIPSSKRAIKNPRNTLIYQDVERVYARKTQQHICDAECKKADHKYYHDFKPGARMYGLPNGDLLIKG